MTSAPTEREAGWNSEPAWTLSGTYIFPLCKTQSASFTSQRIKLIFRSDGLGRPSLTKTQAPISNFTEIYPVVAALVHSNRRTHRQTDWRTKLIGAFHYHANAP